MRLTKILQQHQIMEQKQPTKLLNMWRENLQRQQKVKLRRFLLIQPSLIWFLIMYLPSMLRRRWQFLKRAKQERFRLRQQQVRLRKPILLRKLRSLSLITSFPSSLRNIRKCRVWRPSWQIISSISRNICQLTHP